MKEIFITICLCICIAGSVAIVGLSVAMLRLDIKDFGPRRWHRIAEDLIVICAYICICIGLAHVWLKIL